ncbi:hypothetical protein Moror_6921 [Moniliophthora roreri MCA 2997]|uniref:RING-type E3 ubiquitin transferase n=1 Tax=Moniliophthora roreri (strain MCA 2997) TaxID=1381753 RepID=V2XB37_MONRO|nr:hypothetical protein Moror_6921 [Moniliophthora roreri MCA 2997]
MASITEDRPSTSKPRGICKYYQHPRGCFNGRSCKFLHGNPEDSNQGVNTRLTPYDQSKTCRYFAKGFCKRADKCWFRHTIPEVDEVDPVDELCSICFEKPCLYGLLTGCNHVFCITCIKQWRDPVAKSADVVDSGVHKKCPMCRTPSKFITPSSLFFKSDDPRKDEIISQYKQSMARIPCRYFTKSMAKDKKDPFCPFGKDCFYQHLNDDGTPFVFSEGVDESMRRYQRRMRTPFSADSLFADIFETIRRDNNARSLDWINRLLEEPQLGRLQNTLQAVRNSLQQLEIAAESGPSSGGTTTRNDPPLNVVIAPELIPDANEWTVDDADGPHWDDRIPGPLSFTFSLNDSRPHPWMPNSWRSWGAVNDDDDDDDNDNDNDIPPPLEAIPGINNASQARQNRTSPRVNDVSESGSSIPSLRDVADTDSDWSTTDDEEETAGTSVRCFMGPSPSLEQNGDTDDASDGMPPLEDISDSDQEDAQSERGSSPYSSSRSSPEPARPPPFVTDGRGRVIGASENSNDSDARRSFLSRVMDALF